MGFVSESVVHHAIAFVLSRILVNNTVSYAYLRCGKHLIGLATSSHSVLVICLAHRLDVARKSTPHLGIGCLIAGHYASGNGDSVCKVV